MRRAGEGAGVEKLAFRRGSGTVGGMRSVAWLLPFVASGGLVAAFAWTPACALPTATSDAGTSDTSDSGTSSGSQVTGAGCSQDPTTGVTLCAGISLCPSLTIDTDLYPSCGFRVNGRVIDIECVCNGDALCPVGIPATCTQAQQILGVQSAAIVCAQVNEGRCTTLTAGGGGIDAAASSGCDRDCQSQCGGDPGCYRSCGC